MENAPKFQSDIDGLNHLTTEEKEWYEERFHTVGEKSIVVEILKLRNAVRHLGSEVYKVISKPLEKQFYLFRPNK